ncbi:MAG: transposase [Planctomycetaceae bacterium]|nr:transposase [Planctomycetaceae bacterium]
MQDSLPAGGLRLCREGVEPSGSLRKVSGYISILLSRTSPVARVVYAKRPFAGPQAVLAYLSRYTHRVAISNFRLIALDEAGVTFKWKDYRINGRDRLKSMTLDPAEFIRRFLLHVLPSGFHRIRHYGLFASTVRADNIERARQLLAAADNAPQPSRAEAGGHTEDVSPARRCPCCGGRMIIFETFEGPRPWSSPSPTRIRIDSS